MSREKKKVLVNIDLISQQINPAEKRGFFQDNNEVMVENII